MTQDRNRFSLGLSVIHWMWQHPIHTLVILSVLWIALGGIAEVNWDSVPKTPQGIAQAIWTSETQAFGNALVNIASFTVRAIDFTLDLTSYLGGRWMAQFLRSFMTEYNQPSAAPIPTR